MKKKWGFECFYAIPKRSRETIIAHHKLKLTIDLSQSLTIESYLLLSFKSPSKTFLSQLPTLSIWRKSDQIRGQLVLTSHSSLILQTSCQFLHFSSGHPVTKEKYQGRLIQKGLTIALEGLSFGENAKTTDMLNSSLDGQSRVCIYGRRDGFQLHIGGFTWQYRWDSSCSKLER